MDETPVKRKRVTRFFIWFCTHWYASSLVFLAVALLGILIHLLLFHVPILTFNFATGKRALNRIVTIDFIFFIFFTLVGLIPAVVLLCKRRVASGLLALLTHLQMAFLLFLICTSLVRYYVTYSYENCDPCENEEAWVWGARWQDMPDYPNRGTNGDRYESRSVSNTRSLVFPELQAGETAMNAFAYDCYRVLAGSLPEENIICCPTGQFGLLGILYLGSQGEAKSELATALHWRQDDVAMTNLLQRYYTSDGPKLAKSKVGFFNGMGIWWRSDEVADTTFFEDIGNEVGLNFSKIDKKELCSHVNHWAKEQTGNRITELVKRLDPAASGVAACVACFSGRWAHLFEAHKTERELFRGFNGEQFPVFMMKEEEVQHYYAEDETVEWVCLRYRGYYVMELILPKEETPEAFRNLEANLSDDYLSTLQKNANLKTIDLWLPRFRISNDRECKNLYYELGIRRVFEPGEASGGPGGVPDLTALQFHTKENIFVYEAGTEATSGSAVVMYLSLTRPSLSVRLNHPFIFLIREMASGRVLFLGRYGARE
ncbi:MAG: serpin family protein [Planctomycetia bacterium]|nr:serpin family protein [Planctomycetia bacterium]